MKDFERGVDHLLLAVQDCLQKTYNQIDSRIKNSLVGSNILDIELKPIKNRKTMFLLTIKTDAKPIQGLTKNSSIILSEMEFRVKCK